MFRAPRTTPDDTPVPITTPAHFTDLIKKARWSLVIGPVAAIVWMGTMVATPWALGKVIDQGLATGAAQATFWWAATLVGVVLVQIISGSLRHYHAVQNWLVGALYSKQWLGWQTTRVGAGLTKTHTTGELLTSVDSDAARIGDLLDVASRAVGALITLVVMMWLSLATSTTLGLVILIGVPVVLGITAAATRPLHPVQAAQRREFGALTTLSADAIAGLRILRGVGGENHFLDRYQQQSETLRVAGVHLGRKNARLESLQGLLVGLLLTVVVWVGAREVLAGRLNAGDVVAFFGWALFISTPLRTMSEVFIKVMRARVAFQRTHAILKLPSALELAAQQATRCTPLPDGPLRDVPSGVVVQPRQLTALVSDQPAETAAIAYRISHLFPAETPSALIAGVPLRQWALSAVRAHIALADSQPQLMAGTLRNQLDPEHNLTDQECLTGLQVAAAQDVLGLLPDGLADYVSEKGRSLSGGQRQRVALARAVLRQRPVLVLVEPTSAVDAHTEALVAERVKTHRDQDTTVVVTTSPLWLAHCDQVLVVRDGVVCAAGTHLDLVQRRDDLGDYYRRTVLRADPEGSAEYE